VHSGVWLGTPGLTSSKHCLTNILQSALSATIKMISEKFKIVIYRPNRKNGTSSYGRSLLLHLVACQAAHLPIFAPVYVALFTGPAVKMPLAD